MLIISTADLLFQFIVITSSTRSKSREFKMQNVYTQRSDEHVHAMKVWEVCA